MNEKSLLHLGSLSFFLFLLSFQSELLYAGLGDNDEVDPNLLKGKLTAPQGCNQLNEGEAALTSTQKTPNSIVLKSDYCEHPSQYVCDPKLNVEMRKERHAYSTYQNTLTDLETQLEQHSLRAHGTSANSPFCSGLSVADTLKCKIMAAHFIRERIYTHKRKELALQLFERAKRDVLNFLKAKYSKLKQSLAHSTMESDLRSSADPTEALSTKVTLSELSELSDMISKIQKVNMDFTSVINQNAINDYEAQSVHLKFGKIFNSHSLVIGNVILPNGLIMMVDSAPESFYYVLLHELGHVIGPEYYRNDPSYSNNPFRSELTCLKTERAAHSKEGDFKCFEDKAKYYKSSDPQLANACHISSQILSENPDSDRLPDLDLAQKVGCQSGQLAETSADWLGTEVFGDANRADWIKEVSQIDQSDYVKAQDGQEYIDLSKRFPAISGILQSASYFCNEYRYRGQDVNTQLGPYLSVRDRLDRIMLVHPEIRSALGCSPSHPHLIHCGK